MARDVLECGIVRTRRQRRVVERRAFTLVELSIVVAIIGILAVLAIIGYRKYILYSKITEAQNTVSAIKIAQEDYRGEKGTYANLGGTFCPLSAGNSKVKVQWHTTCSGGVATWETLPVHIDGPVQFQYATTAGATTITNANVAPWLDVSQANATTPWFVVGAKCDLDGDPADLTELAATSHSNQVYSRGEGL